jgi:hypothetical protein
MHRSLLFDFLTRQTTDISFPRNRVGSLMPLKTLWGSTMGVQSPSTFATLCSFIGAKGSPLQTLLIRRYQSTQIPHPIVPVVIVYGITVRPPASSIAIKLNLK